MKNIENVLNDNSISKENKIKFLINNINLEKDIWNLLEYTGKIIRNEDYSKIKEYKKLLKIHKNLIKKLFLEKRKLKPISRNCLLNKKRKIKTNKKIEDFFLILKEPLNGEKGIIYLMFSDVIEDFPLVYDLNKIKDNYILVLEPSWAGYQSPYIYQYIGLDLDIVITCPYPRDYKFIRDLSVNFVPTRLGAGDWCNFKLFKNLNLKKKFDFVMIANFMQFKRIELIIKALNKITHAKLIVIGRYGDKNKYYHEIKNLIKKLDLKKRVKLFKGGRKEVNNALNKSKVNILFSKKEGANRGIYEGFFSNVPVIVYKNHQSIRKKDINKYTGILSTEKDLVKNMKYMLKKYKKFKPLEWAIKNTGYKVSTEKLNLLLKRISKKWTKDIVYHVNAPNIEYLNEKDKEFFSKFYKDLEKYKVN